MKKDYKYDIALSFARADRSVALNIYQALKSIMPEDKLYYYVEKQEDMIGRDLKEKLKEIYKHQARYVISIVSKDYIDKNNAFVQAEIFAFMPRYEMEKPNPYLIAVLVDDTLIGEVDKKLDGITTIKWDYNPDSIALQMTKLLKEADGNLEEKEKEEQGEKGINIIESEFKGPVIIGGKGHSINSK